MYLSKVLVNLKNKDVIYSFEDANFWHKHIMEGFLDSLEPCSNARQKLGVLFRKEVTEKGIILYVQSKVEPNWYGKNWVLKAEVKNIDNVISSFKKGVILSFNLLCTPYYTDKSTNKLRCFSKKEDKINWLKEKEKYNGFILKICDEVYCKEVIKNIGGYKNACLNLTNLKGVLEITDAEKFKTFYTEGVGRQKAYGAGMFLIY